MDTKIDNKNQSRIDTSKVYSIDGNLHWFLRYQKKYYDLKLPKIAKIDPMK